MAEEHSNAEAHLIGSLIDSLSNAGEDDVFLAGNAPHASMPTSADSSFDKLSTYDSSANLQPANLPPHMLSYQVLHQFQQQQPPPQAPFWTPAPNSMPQFRGAAYPPYPVHLAHGAMGQQHGRWIPPPQHLYAQTPPGFSPQDLQQRQQQYQVYLAYQQQMHEMAALRMPPPPPRSFAMQRSVDSSPNIDRRMQSDHSIGPYQQYDQSVSSQGNEQWESIYTPFGPIRSPGAFPDSSPSAGARLVSQRLSLVEDAANSILRDDGQPLRTDGGSISDYELKKRSSSVSAQSMANHSMPNEKSAVSSESSSSMHPSATSTTASSPSLPPKGRSYRDVAKSKTETKAGHSHTKKVTSGTGGQGVNESQDGSIKGTDGEQSAETMSSRPPTGEKKAKTTSTTRKMSAPARESSSDSMSEFGGSENGLSSAPTEQYAVVENIMAGLLDKSHGESDDEGKRGSKSGDDSNPTDRNVLTKNATTATPTTGDFQKIMRRKGSQTKLGTVQGRDPSPGMAGASRYAVLGKKSPANASNTSATLSQIETDGRASNSIGDQRQQQRIKLNNEQMSPRFGSKSPTRKAAYINNDLSWPNKMKSTNRKNEDGDWIDDDDNDDGVERNDKRHPEDEEERGVQDEMDESDEDGDEAYEDGDRGGQGMKKKGETGDGVKNRKKGSVVNAGSTQKFGLKKGKTKRGDSGEMAKKRRQQRGVVMRWINLVLTAIACYIRDAAFWLINLVTDIGHQLWEITVYCAKSCSAKISTSALCAWHSMGERLRKVILCIRQKEWSILLWWRSRRNRGESDRMGLEENIDLPNTGEEALKRLLSCRGQDAYSILGLRPDCTDDEVKCYYRRQAILVHPDKNACYGSDEAFKILAAAFELIGTTERRRAYDLQNLHRTKAMQDLQEMLAKLKEKMEEIRSTMQCDCGGKHKRFPTERELAYARFCRKCGEKHHAREGDIWAESHWFGFLWYYYACMDGVVYDITEWAGCQKNNLKHMKPDTHLVQYRLITGRNARQFHHQQQQQYGGTSSSFGQQQQYANSQQQFTRQQAPENASPAPSGSTAEDLLNRYWEERLASTSKNVSAAASSMYLPPGSMASPSSGTSFTGLGGMDFTTPTQSKFNPPACSSHGDSRPRKAGRRRKPRT